VPPIPEARLRPRGARAHLAVAGAAIGRAVKGVTRVITGFVASLLGV